MRKLKRLAGLGAGIVGLVFIRGPLSRKERFRRRRERILRSYAVAARDPAYLAEEDALIRDFDATVADGLDSESRGG